MWSEGSPVEGAGISLPALCPSRTFPAQLHLALDPRWWNPSCTSLDSFDGGHTLAEQEGLMWPVQCEIFEQVANI